MRKNERAATMFERTIAVIALFLVFDCNGALACNPGWTSYKGRCFKVPQFYADDVRMARRYCMVFGGDLANVKKSEEINFFSTLPSYTSDSTYWLKEDSYIESMTPSYNDSTGCPYAEAKSILTSSCEDKRNFICEIMERKTALGCHKHWHLYDSTCYRTLAFNNSYIGALQYCSIQHGQLAILDNISKEHHVASVIIGQNSSFLVDARRNENGTFEWSNGKQFQPSCPDCVQQGNGDCLGFESNSVHPTLFTWVSLNCSDANYFLCEMEAVVRTTTTSTPATMTTPAPLVCPVGPNWKPHGSSGFCFWETTYESERLNWYQARRFCQAYGGDLATYRDQVQEDFGLGGAKGHYRGLWFGMQRAQNDIIRWVDGSNLNYTNWDHSEPNLRSHKKYCVMHGIHNSRWQLDYCGARRFFVCKAPLVRSQVVPNTDFVKKTTCNITSASRYSHDWFLHNGYCYMTREDPRFTWQMAKNFCNDNEGHLVSIHSPDETDFVLLLGSVSSSSDYWIGLSAIGLGSPLSWSDGTPLDFTFYPDGLSLENVTEVDTCFTVNSLTGSWSPEHCNRVQGVICKRGLNTTLPTPEPTPVLPGNCESGWYNFGNQCYKVFGKKWSQRAKWEEAAANCNQEGASLASIHNEEEQKFVADLMLLSGSKLMWIGLRSEKYGTIFEWNDNSAMEYAYWNINEPSLTFRGKTSCINLNWETAAGHWSTSDCNLKRAYVCQKLKNPNITEPSEDPFACDSIPGWKKLGSSCYGIFNDNSLSWIAAQRKCRSLNSSLVSFSNKVTDLFLEKFLEKKTQFYWSGIIEKESGKYEMLNGKKMKYSRWLSGQPRRISKSFDNCVAMNSDALWMVKSCKEIHSYVCEWNSEIEEDDIIEERHSCPNISEWKDIGGEACYIFNTDYRLSWVDAMSHCFKHGGFLASFHSEKEAALVHQHLYENVDATFLYIGLGKRKDGSYGWVDNTPLDYVHWDVDEPSPEEHCAQLFVRNGKWRSVDCDLTHRGFICSAPRTKAGTGEESTTASNSTKYDTVVASKLAIGGVFGFIICLLVLVAIVGVLSYYTCPGTRMKAHAQLLESDSL